MGDWLLTTERSDKGKAQQWVQVLQRAQIEAQEIAKRINKENEEKDEESDSERECERNDELHSRLANGFEINADNLSNANAQRDERPRTSGFCKCFCLK